MRWCPLTETKTNGRWKFEPQHVVMAVVQLLAIGVATGILIARLAAVEISIAAIKQDYMTRAEATALINGSIREHALMWNAINNKREK